MFDFRRHRFVRSMRKHWIFTVAAVIWFLLGGLSILPLFLSPDVGKKISLYPITSKLDWHMWVLGFVVIAALMLFEGYYDFYKRKTKELRKLENDIIEQRELASKAQAQYLRRSNEIIALQQDSRHKATKIEELKEDLNEYHTLYGDPESLTHRAYVLTRKIHSYLKEKGPEPEMPPVSVGQHGRIQSFFDNTWPFQLRVFNGYSSRFKDYVIKLRDELAEHGYTDQDLNKAIDSPHCDSHRIGEIADGVSRLAGQLRDANERKAEPMPVSEGDPKIVPECNWAITKYAEQVWQDRPITLVNRGGGDAKDIEIGKITRPKGEADFEIVGFIAKDKSTKVMPEIYGPNRTQAAFGMADLLHLMDSEYRFTSGEDTVSLDFLIRYKDSTEHSFVTTAKLIRNPLRGTTEFKELKFMRDKRVAE